MYRALKKTSDSGFSTPGLIARAHITRVNGTKGFSDTSKAAHINETTIEKPVDMRPSAARAKNMTNKI